MSSLKRLFELNQFIIKSFLLIKLIHKKDASLEVISKKYKLLENKIVTRLIDAFLSNYYDRLEDEIIEYYKIDRIDSSSYLIYNLLIHKCEYLFLKSEFSSQFSSFILREKEIDLDYERIESNLDKLIDNLLSNVKEKTNNKDTDKLKRIFNMVNLGCLYDFIWPNKVIYDEISNEKEITPINPHIEEILLKIIQTILDKIDNFEKIRIILIELNISKSTEENRNDNDEVSRLSIKRSADNSSSSLLTDDLSTSCSTRDSKMPRLMSEDYNESMSLPIESLFKCSSPLKLPINKLPGIGRAYATKLNQNNVHTFGDLINIYEKISEKNELSFQNEMKSLINMKNDSINRLIYLIKSYFKT